MMINYKNIDLFSDIQDNDIILHVVNDVGKWRGVFIKRLDAWDDFPKKRYRYWRCRGYHANVDYALGEVQFVEWDKALSDDRVIHVVVGNMLSQRGLVSKDNLRPFCLSSFRSCLSRVVEYIDKKGWDYNTVNIKCPKLGCGLGGGNWSEVSGLLKDYLCSKGINVTVYSLE
jgi:hypothetical protein